MNRHQECGETRGCEKEREKKGSRVDIATIKGRRKRRKAKSREEGDRLPSGGIS